MLHNDLKNLKRYPFHMPGHKRNPQFGISGSEIDITEIDGFDNLHSPAGSLLEIEKKLAGIYGAEKSFMLINGSTGGILAAVLALCGHNDKIIIARNCHKSVYNACIIRELHAVFIEPEFNSEYGYYTEISQESIDKAVLENPDAKAIVITTPTYEGVASSVKADIPLIIDCAHGAHFGFSEFPDYPQGDIVVSSLHKTLTALTQTAVLNVYNKNMVTQIGRYLDILQTSSPSYVLMNSVSICVETVINCPQLFDESYNNLKLFYKNTKLEKLKFIINNDIGKIIVSTNCSSINALQLAEILRNNYLIEPEMVSMEYLILMTSIADDKSAYKKLSEALTETDRKICRGKPHIFKKPQNPDKAVKFSETVSPCCKTPLAEACGKKSAEFVYAYPPDIPIIFPNQTISEETVTEITDMISGGINIVSDSNLLPGYILTKTE